MEFRIKKSRLSGRVRIPGSKSHTIRGLILGALADGESVLRGALDSSDTRSCLAFIRALGADIDVKDPRKWILSGTWGRPLADAGAIDVGNSGTTLFLGMGAAALGEKEVELTGDEQTRRRDAAPLLRALSQLGATAYSRAGNGCAPLVVGGGLEGGEVTIECPTSQYLSALLIACPLARLQTTVSVPLLHEKPYVGMTLQWLRELGVKVEHDCGYGFLKIPGNQRYGGFDRSVPGDFSSAAFFLVGAAVTGSELLLEGLDMSDSQGDKAVVGMLEEMGCEIDIFENSISVRGPERLKGGEFDLNATPDALPAMAVAGAMARGRTHLANVPQARMKETDRIAVMASELTKMGAKVEALPDGLIISGGELRGADLHGHGDHRVVMALSVAGMAASGQTRVDTAGAAAITFPEFPELMRRAGGRLVCIPEPVAQKKI